MSRYPDPPAVQAAKGFPGKRQTKVEKQQLAEANRLAQSMTAEPSSSEFLAPPRFIAGNPLFAAALAVWEDLAPRLSRMQLLQPLDRYSFAMACVHAAEWVAATEAIEKEGYVTKVKTVSGDYMPRRNPNVHRRDAAEKMFLEWSSRIGLSASDRSKILRQQSVLPAGLFDERKPVAREPDTAAAAVTPDAIGAMDTFDTPAPDGLPN